MRVASYKRRQCSDNNQSVQETENVPETHAYQEKHFQPTLNAPVPEGHPDTEYGSTVTPDKISSRDDKSPRSTFTESSDQPGEDDILDATIRQDLQGNSDPGMHYSTPDVSSGVSSDPGGFSGFETGTVAASASASSAAGTVVASSFATSSAAAAISSAAVATAGAALIAATIILPLVIGVPSAIIFDEISVTDTTVYYTIYFEDYEEDMDLTVSLHNIFTDRSHAVEGHSISVLEENLKPGMEYQLTVYGSMGTVLDERTVKTSEESAHPELDVTVAEFSKSDGLIHLSAELDDPNGKCSDFRAVFYDETDKKHTEVRSVSISNFDSEITMDVGLASDTSVDGTFTVECIIDGENAVLY